MSVQIAASLITGLFVKVPLEPDEQPANLVRLAQFSERIVQGLVLQAQ
jgi:hypothetical protein